MRNVKVQAREVGGSEGHLLDFVLPGIVGSVLMGNVTGELGPDQVSFAVMPAHAEEHRVPPAMERFQAARPDTNSRGST